MRFRRPPIAISAVPVVALAILAAGCGGGGSPGVANVNASTSASSSTSSGAGGSPTESQIQQENRDADRFAACMRSHGVSIPDPSVAPHAFKDAFNSRSPGFRSADTICGHLLPPGHASNQSTPPTRAQTAALLAFAHCLRGRGFPGFPDPASSGELTHEMLARAGIDLHQPALIHAADACTGVTHGVITKAVVAHFVAGR
jgi:hypothetical protein